MAKYGSGARYNTFRYGQIQERYLNEAAAGVAYALGGDLAPNYSFAVLADHPLAYWRLGETVGPTAFDSSGNGNHGTYQGDVRLGAESLIDGDEDTAIDTPGTSGSSAGVSLPSLGQPDAVSLECWLRSATVGYEPGQAHRMALTLDGATYISCSKAAGGAFRLFTSLRIGVVQWTLGSGLEVVVGQTYYVVVTYDGSNIRFYVDGVLLSSRQVPSGPVSLNGPSRRIGGYITNLNNWAGRIDDVAVYDYALSSDRVMSHYLARGTRYTSEAAANPTYAQEAI